MSDRIASDTMPRSVTATGMAEPTRATPDRATSSLRPKVLLMAADAFSVLTFTTLAAVLVLPQTDMAFKGMIDTVLDQLIGDQAIQAIVDK